MVDGMGWKRWCRGLGRSLALLLLLGLFGCAIPQLKAEDRLFLPVSADLLDVYTLPPQEFEGTTVGGLSALAYDRPRDLLYALSDDRGQFGQSRFYTLALQMAGSASPRFGSVSLTAVTPLSDGEGNPYPRGYLDPEGMALSPRDTLFIASEGDARRDAPPLLGEFDRATGRLMSTLRIPDRFLPDGADGDPQTQGVQNNLSFESLAINAAPGSAGQIEPFRLFTATESALVQDYDGDPAQPLNSRFLHYLVGEDQSTLIAEHRYPLDLEPSGAVVNGLTSLVVLDQGGHFLALERSFGLRGFTAKLYQLATGGATDTSTIASLRGDVSGISPIRKQLVIDFADTPLAVDNLEGMTLGPRLPDGNQSLLIVSDNNFEGDRATQLILLRLQIS